MTRLTRACAVAVLLSVSVMSAQEPFGGRYSYGFRRMPPRFPTATSFDGGFNFCRLMYSSQRREAGG